MSKDRILLIMGHQGNRRLLSELLSRSYEVILAREERDLDNQFDLGILDGPALNRLRLQIRARKNAEEPVFLPFLLATDRQDPSVLSRDLWRTVDELLLTPVHMVELEGRVESLLEIRRDSLNLRRRSIELEALIADLFDAFESATDEEQLADILLSRALASTNGHSGVVLLLEGSQPRIIASKGEELIQLINSPDSDSITALKEAIQHGVAVSLSKAETLQQGLSNKPTTIAPLLIRHEHVGALIIQKEFGSRFDEGELSIVESLCSQAGVFLHNLRQAHRLVEAARVQEQVELAETIQRQLLPNSDLDAEGLDIAALYLATNAVGGDYYDVFRIGPNTVGAVIADVSGHSIASGLMMTAARSAVRLLVRNESSPAEVLRQLNDALYTDLDRTGLFISIFLIVVDTDKRVAYYANAGHNPTFYYCATTGEVETLDATGLLTGILPDIGYDELEVPLENGDVLVLYTDGITEARSRNGEMFGEDRLRDIIIKSEKSARAGSIVESIVREINDHSQNELTDDVTLVVIKVASEK